MRLGDWSNLTAVIWQQQHHTVSDAIGLIAKILSGRLFSVTAE